MTKTKVPVKHPDSYFPEPAIRPIKAKVCKLVCSIILAGILSGCIYKIDIQQGNEITPEMVAKIEVGMTKREVAQVLGHPLINDPFHKDRWDYYYSIKDGKTGETQRQFATLKFENDILSSVESSF